MARWRSHFVRHYRTGSISHTYRDHSGDDSAACAAAIRHALQGWEINGCSPDVSTFIEPLPDSSADLCSYSTFPE